MKQMFTLDKGKGSAHGYVPMHKRLQTATENGMKRHTKNRLLQQIIFKFAQEQKHDTEPRMNPVFCWVTMWDLSKSLDILLLTEWLSMEKKMGEEILRNHFNSCFLDFSIWNPNEM